MGRAVRQFAYISTALSRLINDRGYHEEISSRDFRLCRDELISLFPCSSVFIFFSFIFFPSGDVTINRGDNREYLVFIAGHAAAFFHCEIGSWQPEKTKTPGNKKQRRIISITTLIKIQMKHLKTVRAE